MRKLTKAKTQTLLSHAKFIKANNPKMRLGQALSKLISLQYPAIYKDIQGTDNDPFYSNELIDKCLTEITE